MLVNAELTAAESEWAAAVAVLILIVPIGAFLSFYAVLTACLFRTVREGIPVVVVIVLALGLNCSAFLVLFDSVYNELRFLIVPLVSAVAACAAGCLAGLRARRITLRQPASIWPWGHKDQSWV